MQYTNGHKNRQRSQELSTCICNKENTVVKWVGCIGMLWSEASLVHEAYFSFDQFESIIPDSSHFKNKIANGLQMYFS